MFLMIIANILGFFFFLYFLWRKLKEDYQYERIFNLGFSTIIGIFISHLFILYFHLSYQFWIYLLGAILGSSFLVVKQRMKFFEVFEGLTVGLYAYSIIVYLSDAITSKSLNSFLLFWFSSISMLVYFYLNSKYRSFVWYKSGRVGFSSMVSLIIFFISRAVMFRSNLLEVIFSVSATLLLIGLLYNLSRSED